MSACDVSLYLSTRVTACLTVCRCVSVGSNLCMCMCVCVCVRVYKHNIRIDNTVSERFAANAKIYYTSPVLREFLPPNIHIISILCIISRLTSSSSISSTIPGYRYHRVTDLVFAQSLFDVFKSKKSTI